MGYNMHQVGSKFRILAANKKAAREAVKKVVLEENSRQGSSEEVGSCSLADLASQVGWALEEDHDDTEDVVGIQFMSEKLWQSDVALMKALAPFVVAGSYVELVGGDGEKWRWVFDGSKMEEKRPKTTW